MIRRAWPAAALTALALLWGYNWVVMKVAVQYAPPFEFAAMRLLLGALTLFAVMAALRKPLAPQVPLQFALIGIFQSGGFIGLAMWAVMTAGAGKVAVLAYTMPLWVALIGAPLLKERINALQYAAIGVAVIGIVLILDVWNVRGSFFADAIALAAGASWAIGVVLTKRLQQRERVEVFGLTTWQLLFGGIVVGIVALVVPEGATHWTPVFIGALLYNAVLASALAYLLWIAVLGRLTARDAGMATLSNPIVGIIAAWLQLGEVPSTIEAIGMALVVAALASLAWTAKA